MQPERLRHTIDPVFDERSRVLLLGSFPSPKSREVGFFYGHPQNRMWKVLAAVTLRNRIAMWDVIASCRIEGASDASIREAVPNDLSRILDVAPIGAVFCTGAKAFQLYRRCQEAATGIPARKLPSTSGANAAWSFDRLVEAYRVVAEALKEGPACL